MNSSNQLNVLARLKIYLYARMNKKVFVDSVVQPNLITFQCPLVWMLSYAVYLSEKNRMLNFHANFLVSLTSICL